MLGVSRRESSRTIGQLHDFVESRETCSSQQNGLVITCRRKLFLKNKNYNNLQQLQEKQHTWSAWGTLVAMKSLDFLSVSAITNSIRYFDISRLFKSAHISAVCPPDPNTTSVSMFFSETLLSFTRGAGVGAVIRFLRFGNTMYILTRRAPIRPIKSVVQDMMCEISQSVDLTLFYCVC